MGSVRVLLRAVASLGYGVRLAILNLVFVLGFSGGAQAEEVVIAALGDSLTAGYGLPQEDGFVAQMQGWLDGQGAEVRLINAGVSGDTTAGGLARVEWTLTPDVDAMIVALGGNDFLRGIDPDVSRENLAGILGAAEARGIEVLLVGMQATPNYGADYRMRFDAMYPDLAAEFDTLHMRSWFDGLRGAASGDLVAARSYFQADGIHPSAEGVALIVEEMGPRVLELMEAVK